MSSDWKREPLTNFVADAIEGYKTGLAGGPMGFVSAAFDCGWTHGAQERADSAVPSSHVSDHSSALSNRGSGKAVRRPDGYIDALLKLLDYCDASDDAQYGTLSVSLVRKLVNEALASDAALWAAYAEGRADEAEERDARVECKACEGSGRGEPIGDYGAYYRDGEVYEFPGWKDCEVCGGTGEAVCAELAPTTASAPANSEADVLWVHDFGGPTETIHNERPPFGEESEWTEFRRASSSESILREALARLVEADDELEKSWDDTRVRMFYGHEHAEQWRKAREAARSALAGMNDNGHAES